MYKKNESVDATNVGETYIHTYDERNGWLKWNLIFEICRN